MDSFIKESPRAVKYSNDVYPTFRPDGRVASDVIPSICNVGGRLSGDLNLKYHSF